MNEESKRIGSILQSKRREMNLSLKEIENATSIRTGCLEAIEEGSIHEFISGVYAIGFLKQYTAFLGFDVEEIMRLHPHAFRSSQEKHEFDYGIGTLEVRGSLGGGVKWLPSLTWAIVASLIVVAAWYLAKYLGVI